MDFLQATILAIVEGITEFLPISSTGHLVLTAQLLNIPQTEFVKSFEIFIQLGAILAVVALYWKLLLTHQKLWSKLFVAFLPSAVVGLVFYRFIKDVLIGNSLVTLAALFLGGVYLLFLEYTYKEQPHHTESVEKLSYKQALAIGLFQAISVVPGVSRAAATIIGGLYGGAKRKTAVEFSFLLAVPTMLAATGLDLLKSNFAFSGQEYSLLAVGFIGSFVVAILAVKFFLQFIQNHTFIPFGIYRIALAVLFWLIVKPV